MLRLGNYNTNTISRQKNNRIQRDVQIETHPLPSIVVLFFFSPWIFHTETFGQKYTAIARPESTATNHGISPTCSYTRDHDPKIIENQTTIIIIITIESPSSDSNDDKTVYSRTTGCTVS
jgi:hypothetical protein